MLKSLTICNGYFCSISLRDRITVRYKSKVCWSESYIFEMCISTGYNGIVSPDDFMSSSSRPVPSSHLSLYHLSRLPWLVRQLDRSLLLLVILLMSKIRLVKGGLKLLVFLPSVPFIPSYEGFLLVRYCVKD